MKLRNHSSNRFRHENKCNWTLSNIIGALIRKYLKPNIVFTSNVFFSEISNYVSKMEINVPNLFLSLYRIFNSGICIRKAKQNIKEMENIVSSKENNSIYMAVIC